MTKFLCTTALRDFWGHNDHLRIFLGPWCFFPNIIGDAPREQARILPYPWDNREKMHHAAIYQESVYESMLESLVPLLNQVHATNHTQRFWRIILGTWLLHYVQIMHERFISVEAALAVDPLLTTTILAPGSFQTPRYFVDLYRGIEDDIYNLQLYSIILKALGVECDEKEWTWSFLQSRKEFFWRSWQRQSEKIIYYASERLAAKSEVIFSAPYINRNSMLRLLLSGRGMLGWWEPCKTVSLDFLDTIDDHPHRPILSCISYVPKNNFEVILRDNLPIFFPKLYLEGFARVSREMQNSVRKSKSKVLVSSIGFHENELFKFGAAYWAEEGRHIVLAQHGGSYGVARYNPTERLERSVADVFLTWGWDDDDQKTVVLPSAKLSRLKILKQKNQAKSKSVLFIDNAVMRYHYRTWSGPLGGQFLRCLAWRDIFFGSLSQDVFSSMQVRMYSTDYGWHVRQHLASRFLSMHFSNFSESYERQMLEASLVICDANQTTLLESLAADIPTLAFWDPDLWELRPQAKPFFDQLQEVGILFFDPQQAAFAANHYAANPSWWHQKKVREARRIFVHQFARSDDNWFTTWRGYFALNCGLSVENIEMR